LAQAVTTVWRTDLGTTLLNGFNSTTAHSAYFHYLCLLQFATKPNHAKFLSRMAPPTGHDASKEAPKVPVVVGPSGGPSISSPPRISGTINYEIPSGFPQDSQDRVRLAEINAKHEFNKTAPNVQGEWKAWKMRIDCAFQLTRAFMDEIIRLGWGATRTLDCARNFILSAWEWAGLVALSKSRAWSEIEASDEWQELEKLLLKSNKQRSDELPETNTNFVDEKHRDCMILFDRVLKKQTLDSSC
jgi:hypothetical protein